MVTGLGRIGSALWGICFYEWFFLGMRAKHLLLLLMSPSFRMGRYS